MKRRLPKFDEVTGNFRSYTTEEAIEVICSLTTIENRGYETDCYIWNGLRDKDGYGMFRLGNLGTKTHVVSCKLFNQDVPKGYCVLHHCDQPSCWRPDHLFVGTIKDNNKDKKSKGRAAKGETSGMSKLTSIEVLEIRSLYSEHSQESLSKIFNTSQTNISSIIRRATWQHI